MDFKALVKEKRTKAKLTQHHFAEKINVSWITIWRWENGIAKPKEDALEFWVKKLNEI